MSKLDDSPISTDWANLRALFMDMRKFAHENPRHQFLAADDPGHHHAPQRVPRLGWVAFLEGRAEDEQMKMWTITFSNATVSSETLSPLLKALVGTADGRVLLLERVIGRSSRGAPHSKGHVMEPLDRRFEFKMTESEQKKLDAVSYRSGKSKAEILRWLIANMDPESALDELTVTKPAVVEGHAVIPLPDDDAGSSRDVRDGP